MANPVKTYQREMHGKLGFFANWLPGDPIAVGDVGILQAGRFRRTSSLKELGVQFRRKAGSESQDVQYTSTQGTEVHAGGGVGAASPVTGKVTLEFSRAGAFLFHASGLRMQRLENRSQVAVALLEAYEQGRWDSDWLLIEAVHVADRATIVVSQDKSAGVELVADASGVAVIASLADPKVDLRVASTRGTVVHVVGATGLTPLYSCLRVKAPVFRAAAVQPVRGAAGSRADDALRRPSIQALLES